MTFDKINRRTHLYLGLALLPWFLMYGFSSWYFSHPASPTPWTLLAEKPYHLDSLPEKEQMDTVAAKMLTDCGLPATGRFGGYRSGAQSFAVFKDDFLRPTRLTYDADRRRITIERRVFSLPAILTEAHARGGYERGGLFDWLWAFLVDLFSLAMIAWIVSGAIMWWRLRRYYFWGGAAIGVGVVSFAVFLARL